jgi:hypothetical protein
VLEFFQYDQALALKNEGIKVGVISISNRYSFFTLLKSSIGIKTYNKWLKTIISNPDIKNFISGCFWKVSTNFEKRERWS